MTTTTIPQHNKNKYAIVLALTKSSEKKIVQDHSFRKLINLWKCYAEQHNIDFILDTSFNKYNFDGFCTRYRNCAGYAKWHALKKNLLENKYEYIMAVDPDMYVALNCFDANIFKMLIDEKLPEHEQPHIVLRDTAFGESNNAGTLIVRSSRVGLKFADTVYMFLFFLFECTQI